MMTSYLLIFRKNWLTVTPEMLINDNFVSRNDVQNQSRLKLYENYHLQVREI